MLSLIAQSGLSKIATLLTTAPSMVTESFSHAFDRLHTEWNNQCDKLEAAGYKLDDGRPCLTAEEEVLLTQQYLLCHEEGRELMRQLVLVRYSNPPEINGDIRDKLYEAVISNRESIIETLHTVARETWVSNFTLAVDLLESQLKVEFPVYKLMGVSRTYLNKNTVRDTDLKSYSDGTTPSLKTLYQISSLLGVHPYLFLFEKNTVESISKMFRDIYLEYELGDNNIEAIFDTIVRLNESIKKGNHEKEDNNTMSDLISEFVSKIGYTSSGGKMGLRLALKHQDSPELTTALGMAHFCHHLGNLAPHQLLTADDAYTIQEGI